MYIDIYAYTKRTIIWRECQLAISTATRSITVVITPFSSVGRQILNGPLPALLAIASHLLMIVSSSPRPIVIYRFPFTFSRLQTANNFPILFQRPILNSHFQWLFTSRQLRESGYKTFIFNIV